MDKKLLVAILLACLIYLKINEGKKNYLCYCVIALVSVGLLMGGKTVEGFNGEGEAPWSSGPGIKISYTSTEAQGRPHPTLGDNPNVTVIGDFTATAEFFSARHELVTGGVTPLNIGDQLLTINQGQTISYKYEEDLDNYTARVSPLTVTMSLVRNNTIPAPTAPNQYLIIKVVGSDGATDFYFYKVAPSTPGTVTGKCTGNTIAAENIDCSETNQQNVSDYGTRAGTSAVECCMDTADSVTCGINGPAGCTATTCNAPVSDSDLYQISVGGAPAAAPGSIEFTEADQRITVSCSSLAADRSATATIAPCTVGNGRYELNGCTRAAEESVTCSSPTDQTGYTVTGTNLARDSFSVTATCASGYTGNAIASPCPETGGPYTLSGCSSPAPRPVEEQTVTSSPECSPSSPPCDGEKCEDDGDDGCRKKCDHISSPSPCPEYCESDHDEDGKCQDKTNYVLWIGIPVAVVVVGLVVYFKIIKKSNKPAGDMTESLLE